MSLVLDKKGIQLSGSVIFGVVQDEKDSPSSSTVNLNLELSRILLLNLPEIIADNISRFSETM